MLIYVLNEPTSAKLINHMKEKGIRFNLTSEAEAINCPTKVNHYSKLIDYLAMDV